MLERLGGVDVVIFDDNVALTDDSVTIERYFRSYVADYAFVGRKGNPEFDRIDRSETDDSFYLYYTVDAEYCGECDEIAFATDTDPAGRCPHEHMEQLWFRTLTVYSAE